MAHEKILPNHPRLNFVKDKRSPYPGPYRGSGKTAFAQWMTAHKNAEYHTHPTVSLMKRAREDAEQLRQIVIFDPPAKFEWTRRHAARLTELMDLTMHWNLDQQTVFIIFCEDYPYMGSSSDDLSDCISSWKYRLMEINRDNNNELWGWEEKEEEVSEQ